MVFPPGQGKFGSDLMALWRQYLEHYADREGEVEGQIIVGGYHSAEVFGSLSLMLDREGRYRPLIDQRIGYFQEGVRRASAFDDCLVNATFTLYNHLNTLAHQFSGKNSEAGKLISQVDDQVRLRTEWASQAERAAAALKACFPLLSLMTLVLDQKQDMTEPIRQIEARFAAGDARAGTEWERMLNALYRTVEMLQLFVTLSDPELRDQVGQIAARFQEEDQPADLHLKLRNGFCRAFELGHLLTTHLDAVLSP